MPNPMNGRFAALYRGTPSERALEPAVAALGHPYRTNFPLYLYEGGCQFFPDFVIPSLGLVIEVDGDSHNETALEDAERSRILKETYGWTVVRCRNEEAEADPWGTVTRALAQAGLRRPLGPALRLDLPAPRTRPARRRGKASRKAAPKRTAVRQPARKARRP